MLAQILRVVRLLGLRRAVRMKRHHEQGLKYVRGYAATACWFGLLEVGLLDELSRQPAIELDRFARDQDLDPDILRSTCEYLDGIGLLARDGGVVCLTDSGRVLLAEPRGLFELLYAYEPCFTSLAGLLRREKQYGREVHRRITWVGQGSGRLCEQLPYPVMRNMVLTQGAHTVIDLGCGDLAFLMGLCRLDPTIRGHGIDFSEEMIAFDRRLLARDDFAGRLSVQQGDMFDLPPQPEALGQIDCITACDTFHEYLPDTDRLVGLLQNLRARFPDAAFVIGEFCLQDPQWLRKHPTASLEHHLFHELSNQQIGTAALWRDVFTRAGLQIVDEQVYDLVGHGYFALR